MFVQYGKPFLHSYTCFPYTWRANMATAVPQTCQPVMKPVFTATRTHFMHLWGEKGSTSSTLKGVDWVSYTLLQRLHMGEKWGFLFVPPQHRPTTTLFLWRQHGCSTWSNYAEISVTVSVMEYSNAERTTQLVQHGLNFNESKRCHQCYRARACISNGNMGKW